VPGVIEKRWCVMLEVLKAILKALYEIAVQLEKIKIYK